MNTDHASDLLLTPMHWRSSITGRPLCGAPNLTQTQARGEVSCARCLWHLQEARRRSCR